jgi:hypothetical protein
VLALVLGGFEVTGSGILDHGEVRCHPALDWLIAVVELSAATSSERCLADGAAARDKGSLPYASVTEE